MPVTHQRFTAQHLHSAGGPQLSKGKAPMTYIASQGLDPDEAQQIWQLHFGMDKMEAYYLSFKETLSITIEAQFEVDSFKNNFPDIYSQINIHDWEPFTIPVDPYSLS
ncbi:hypothetical protein HAX54_043283, partial [Datura stramonium]|nr:hypothetical protein [Datura stramonium]